MTSIVDSKAHFLKRCREVGLSDRAVNALIANGFGTLGTLAFGVGQPGVALVDGEFQTFARNSLGALASIAEISTLKRLVFESHTMLLALLREQVSNPQASASRPLPAVEREAKLRDLRARLGGVVREQQLEPSHHLIDLFSQQWEAKQLEYVSPEKCTSREWEIMRGESNKQLSLDNEKLLIKEEKSVPDQPVTSSELLILESMRRRGVAMACVDIISWEVHECYLQKLFSHLRADPPMKVTIQQVMRADRQVFMFMIKEDVSLRRLPDNTLQMDTMIMEALKSYEVSFHLVPLPKTATPLVKTPRDGAWNSDQDPWTPGVAPYHKGKGKGKKGKGKKPINVLPKALHNVGQDDHGRRLCLNSIWENVIKPRMELSAGMGFIFAAVKDALPFARCQSTRMVRRIDGLSASLSLLLMVRD